MQKIKIALKDAVSFVFYVLLHLIPSRKKSVLVYHSVDNIDPAIDPWRMNLTPEAFEKHLRFLSGYKGDFEITFDDGYKNNFTHAYPLLLKYNLNATFFITTDFIDGSINSKKIWPIKKMFPPLAWEDIRKMAKGGMRIGAHGKTHPVLAGLPEEKQRKEIVESKRRIEEMVGKTVDSFSYPKGHKKSFSRETKILLSSSGYKYAYTNVMGFNSTPPEDRYGLKRIRIYAEDNTFRLKMKIKGAYNWVDWFRSENHP